MKVGLGNDHAGLAMRQTVFEEVAALGHQLVDFGTDTAESVDFPDYAGLVGQALQRGEVERGILICGSGVGMCIAANKVQGARASIAHDTYSARQGVEHDGMNILCLGSRVIGDAVVRELIRAFLVAKFQQEERFIRRMDKVNSLEAARAQPGG